MRAFLIFPAFKRKWTGYAEQTKEPKDELWRESEPERARNVLLNAAEILGGRRKGGGGGGGGCMNKQTSTL